MSIVQVLVLIVVSIGGASGFYTLYTANAKKESITIGNLEKIIDDMRKQIGDLTEKVQKLSIELDICKKSISHGYRCKIYSKDKICPIINALDEENKNK